MLLSRQARMEGFWVGQFEDRNAHALDRLSHWVRNGTLKYKEDEDVLTGLTGSASVSLKIQSALSPSNGLFEIGESR